MLSVNALREDLGVAHATINAWLDVFEALYMSFTIRPYTTRLARSVAKAPKLYLFDILQIPKERHSARLENLTAIHLLKACNDWTDTAQGVFDASVQLVDKHGYDRTDKETQVRVVDYERFFSGWV